MYLENFKRTNQFAPFDPETGSLGTVTEEEQEMSGFFYESDSGLVALYLGPERQTIYVQIGDDTWDLSDPDLDVNYQYVGDDETYFSISNGQNRHERTYEAWWTDLPDIPVDDMITRQDLYNDDEEDIFAYIEYIVEEERVDDLVEIWTNE